MVAIPVYVRHTISFREGAAGRFDVTIGPKQTMGKTVSYSLKNFYLVKILKKSWTLALLRFEYIRIWMKFLNFISGIYAVYFSIW